ncbi:hypothetical protein GCM10017687_29510 [Streptomyces echinatus]
MGAGREARSAGVAGAIKGVPREVLTAASEAEPGGGVCSAGGGPVGQGLGRHCVLGGGISIGWEPLRPTIEESLVSLPARGARFGAAGLPVLHGLRRRLQHLREPRLRNPCRFAQAGALGGPGHLRLASQ